MVVKNNELKIKRVYEAPVEAVWDAWTDPKQVAKWWGPRGFTITTHAKDLRPGGQWRYTMHGPDGTDYPNVTTYFEVETHAKLVYDHGATDDTPALFRVTVTFAEKNGRTTMDMTMRLETPEDAAKMAKFVKQAGGNSTWDRLAEYLETSGTGRENFVINRTFATSIEHMFDLWTDPKLMVKWFGPTGSSMEFRHLEVKAGGSGFYRMWGEGYEMYGRFDYVELRRPDRIVYTQQFADADGKVSRHPFAPTWPETMRTTVHFTAEGPNLTRVTLTWKPVGDVTAEELAAFVKEKGGMTQGWSGSFDRLDSHLADE